MAVGEGGGRVYWSQSLACRDLNSLTRDQSHPRYSGSSES